MPMVTVLSSARAAATHRATPNAAPSIEYLEIIKVLPFGLHIGRAAVVVFRDCGDVSLSRPEAKEKPCLAAPQLSMAAPGIERRENSVRHAPVVGRLRRARAQTKFADRLLPADRGAGHLALETEQIDGQSYFAHFRGAPDAVGHDPLQHVGRALLPVEAGVGV